MKEKTKKMSVSRAQLLDAIAKLITYRNGLANVPHHVIKCSPRPPEAFQMEWSVSPHSAAIAKKPRATPISEAEVVTVSQEQVMHALSLHLALTPKTLQSPYSGNCITRLPKDFPKEFRIVLRTGLGEHRIDMV